MTVPELLGRNIDWLELGTIVRKMRRHNRVQCRVYYVYGEETEHLA